MLYASHWTLKEAELGEVSGSASIVEWGSSSECTSLPPRRNIISSTSCILRNGKYIQCHLELSQYHRREQGCSSAFFFGKDKHNVSQCNCELKWAFTSDVEWTEAYLEGLRDWGIAVRKDSKIQHPPEIQHINGTASCHWFKPSTIHFRFRNLWPR